MVDINPPTSENPSVIVPVHPAIEGYMRGLVEKTDHPVLLEMEELAVQKSFPIVNRLVGIFLETQAKMIGAKHVFEFGSGYGYSAYWFARAVGTDGRVICSDGNGENKGRAERFLASAGLWDRIEFNVGMAGDIFAQTDGPFDICYNDVDKGEYPEIWKMARERIRPGGLYIADNVLWHGRVAVESYTDIVLGWTEAIVAHNQMIFNDPDFDAFINPVRDGVIVARRKDG
ncbi:Predicted O-methyltransferase YrrM [Nitrosomonas aestuarii]|uniref:Predicted O-methyltransferase YrrM n=1 Tax=Nitrosomonas aestuarii TaxID=52441 RepID=A0A1I4AWP1_9PROT|nr:O-methyltransferase [Nitrosomonas aestuarii]SFK60291.1 Predicted O-methyltransferase YrrM [Nitrosomonas aestuarii]